MSSAFPKKNVVTKEQAQMCAEGCEGECLEVHLLLLLNMSVNISKLGCKHVLKQM